METIVSFIELNEDKKFKLITLIVRVWLTGLIANKVMNMNGYYFDGKVLTDLGTVISFFLSGGLVVPAICFGLIYWFISQSSDLLFVMLSILIAFILRKFFSKIIDEIIKPLETAVLLDIVKYVDGKLVKGKFYPLVQKIYSDINGGNNAKNVFFIFTSIFISALVTFKIYHIDIDFPLLYILLKLTCVYCVVNYICLISLYLFGKNFLNQILLLISE